MRHKKLLLLSRRSQSSKTERISWIIASKNGANRLLFRPAKDHSTTHIDIEVPRPNIAPSHIHTSSINLHQDKPTEHHHTHNYLNSTIDIAERQYRTRVQPNFQERVSITSTVEPSKVIINDKMGYYDEDGKSR